LKNLIFNGSPRKDGDTVYAINELSEKLNGDIKLVNSYHSNIRPCNDCRHCLKIPECIIDDEMQNVYRYLVDCDNIVIASPIYFNQVTGSLLNVFSRLQMLWTAKMHLNKSIITKEKQSAIILCGGGVGDFKNAEATAKIILKQMNGFKYYLGCIVFNNTDNLQSRDNIKSINNLYSLAENLNKGLILS